MLNVAREGPVASGVFSTSLCVLLQEFQLQLSCFGVVNMVQTSAAAIFAYVVYFATHTLVCKQHSLVKVSSGTELERFTHFWQIPGRSLGRHLSFDARQASQAVGTL